MAGINGPGASLVSNYMARMRMGRSTDYRGILPICSALEIQSHKNALQLCIKAIKKQPDNYLVLSLKALALSQVPRPLSPISLTEIMSISNFIMTNAAGVGMNDPDVLSFMSWVLGSIGQPKEVLIMLGKATTLFPTNEDVCMESFLHYIRVGERKSAQQLSMKMQKNFKDPKYLWWSIMSIILQVRDLENPTNSILLSLAERQISEHYTLIRTAAGIDGTIKDKGKGKATDMDTDIAMVENVSTPLTTHSSIRFGNAHEFHLITRFLELRVLNADALEAATSNTSSPTSTISLKPITLPSQALVLPSIVTNPSLPMSLKEVLLAHFASEEGNNWCERGLGLEIWRRECELKFGSLEGGDWKNCWNRLEKSLRRGDTNWHTMLYLIRCTFSIAAGSSQSFSSNERKELNKLQYLPSEEGKILLEESRKLFRSFVNEGEKGKKERGYLLALLEIARESKRRDWEEEVSLLTLIQEYFEKFSSKMCCFDDLRPYFTALTEEERLHLFEEMSIEDINSPSSVGLAQSSISRSKIARYISVGLSEESENAAAEKYLIKYFEALPLGKRLPITELQPADDFALLAAQSFVSAWDISHERKYLEKAAAVLELATGRSKYKYQLRILLTNILRLLGASTLALSNYNLLDIKSVQFDTLAHLITSRASTFSLAQNQSGNSNSSQGSEGIVEVNKSAAKWYRTGIHEAREMPVRAFSFSNHTMIEDFIVFQERLTTSLSKDVLIIENLRMQVLAGLFESKDDLSSLVSTISAKRSDNRDFKTLPNLQPESQKGVWEQTSMGPIIGVGWLRTFVAIYSNFLLPSEEISNETSANAELTESESALLAFSKVVRTTISSNFDDLTSDEFVLEFFKSQETQFVKAVENTSTLPWELFHIAEITFEGSCLFGITIEEAITGLTARNSSDVTKQIKRLKSLKSSTDSTLKQLSSKVTAHGKQVGKQRSKTMLALNGLEKFPLMNEDQLLNFAHALTDSRKTLAEGFASALHRRMK